MKLKISSVSLINPEHFLSEGLQGIFFSPELLLLKIVN